MSPAPSTGSSGVAWVVLWVRQVPVRDQRGRLLVEPWNTRTALRAPKTMEIDTVRAANRGEALFRARQRFRQDRDNQIEVQAAISRAIGTDDLEIVKRTRISPRVASTKRRRTVHAQTP